MTQRSHRHRTDDALVRELHALPGTAVMLLSLAAIAAGGAVGAHVSARGEARTEAAAGALDDALRRGAIARGGARDVAAWAARHRAGGGPVDPAALHRLATSSVYVVRDALAWPRGARGAVFVVPAGRRVPAGDPGASTVLDMATGACRGARCRGLAR